MTRNIDPEVGRRRGRVAALALHGRHEDAEAERLRLDEAKRRAALLTAAADPPPITAAMFAVIVRRLGRVVVDD